MTFEIKELINLAPSDKAEAERIQKMCDRLQTKLHSRAAEIKLYDDYYEGKHRLGFATPKFREAFGSLFKELSDNWCALVVDAVEERLNLEGFRLGDSTAADDDAWALWQANGMDALSQILHTEALIHKIAYVMVGAGQQEGTARLTVEHPAETIVAWDPADRRIRRAAFKRWTDELMGTARATLWTPTRIYRFEGEAPEHPNMHDSIQWTLKGDGPEDNQLGLVPFVPYINKPRLLGEGASEIAGVIPIQDAINKTVADLLVTSEYFAMPQRWATGLEIPTSPETGQAVDPFKDPHLKRFFYSEDPESRLGQFDGADLTNFISAIEMFVQHVASQTRTPPHYFVVGGEPPSGESIKSSETGLVAKTRRKQRHFGESHEEVMRLAGIITGNDALTDPSMEAIWSDPESRTEGEHIDATLKKQALGVPQEQLWEDAGYSPQQRARFRTDQAAERLLLGMLEPAPEPVG